MGWFISGMYHRQGSCFCLSQNWGYLHILWQFWWDVYDKPFFFFLCPIFMCIGRAARVWSPKFVWGLCSSWRPCWSSCGHTCLSCRIWGWVKTNDIPMAMGGWWWMNSWWTSIYQLWHHRDLAPRPYEPRHCGSCERESRAGPIWLANGSWFESIIISE